MSLEERTFEKRMAELRNNLQTAVELELSTIPPYLSAAFSLPPRANRESFSIIHSVYMEEMLHLLLAGNVLNAVGGTVRLGPGNIPEYPLRLEFDGQCFKQREFDVDLQRFSPEAIDIFLQIELPENWPEPMMRVASVPEIDVPGYTIGEFYELIKDELASLVSDYGHDRVFSGERRLQIGEPFYWGGGGKPIVVHDLDSANEAIDVIVDQGEGADMGIFDGDAVTFGQMPEVAHFFRFNEIKEGRRYAPTDKPHDPPSGPEFEVDYSAVYPTLKNPRASSYARGSEAARLNDDFNQQYSLMLYQLEAGFAGNQKLIYTAIRNSMAALPEIASRLVRTPLPDDPETTAAPSFEWNPRLIPPA